MIVLTPSAFRVGPVGLDSRQALALVRDTFSRPDNPTSLGTTETGQAWTAPIGTWGVLGQQAYTASATPGDLVTVDTGIADYTVQALVTSTDYVIGSPNLVFRFVSTTTFLRIAMDTTTLYLTKREGGIDTILATAAFSAANGTAYTLKARATGASIVLAVDGVQKINWTLVGADATTFAAPTLTLVGLRAGGTTVAGLRFDDFTVRRG